MDEKEILKKGDQVFVKQIHKQGKVLEVKGVNISVEVNERIFVVKLDNLSLIKQTNCNHVKKQVRKENNNKKKFEIDLHGYTKVDATQAVEELIKNAISYSAREVRIVHGKGSGILRIAIHDLLKRYKRQNKIKNYNFASIYDGGHGATIVSL
jgi:DNA mismatch repair protein MutS2